MFCFTEESKVGDGQLIAVLTDHPNPRILLLEYSRSSISSTPYLTVIGHQSLESKSLREAEFIHTLTVSPDGKVIVAAPYAGKVTITAVDNNVENKLKEMSDVK